MMRSVRFLGRQLAAMLRLCAAGADSPEHRFLADHIVDNRILMPAVSYVVTAWHAAAEAAGLPPAEVPRRH